MSDLNCARMLRLVSIFEGHCTIFTVVDFTFREVQPSNKDDSTNRAKRVESTNVSDRGNGPIPCQIQIKSGTT